MKKQMTLALVVAVSLVMGSSKLLAQANRVVVAKSGGNYTSISAALAAISPSASKPYVIDVMPGTYTENVTMKSYVHVRGAGREVTVVKSPYTNVDVFVIQYLTDVAISGLTATGGWDGIGVFSSAPTISDNALTGNTASGVANFSASSILTGNLMTQNGYFGIYNYNTAPGLTITNNTISGNKGYGVEFTTRAGGTMMGNNITGNLGGRGLSVEGTSFPTIVHNSIFENYSGNNYGLDIYLDSSSSFGWVALNMCQTSAGLASGRYNVNPQGPSDPCIPLLK